MKKKIKKLPFQDDPLYLFIPDGDLKRISKDIGLIKPNPKNPRINDIAIQGVIGSIKQYGFRDPIEVDGKNMIIAGHTRYKAAKKLGMKYVPVIMSTFDNKGRALGYTVINNKTGELAQWDNDQLILIKDEFGFKAEELGFTEKELGIVNFSEFDTEDEKIEVKREGMLTVEIEFLPEDYKLFLQFMQAEKIVYKSCRSKTRYGIKLGQLLRRFTNENTTC